MTQFDENKTSVDEPHSYDDLKHQPNEGDISDGTMSVPGRPRDEDEDQNPIKKFDHDLTQDEIQRDPDYEDRKADAEQRLAEGDVNENGEVNDASVSGTNAALTGTTSEELNKQPSVLDDRGRMKGLYLDDVEAAQAISRRNIIEAMHAEEKRPAELVDAPFVSAEESQTGVSESAAENGGRDEQSGDFGKEPEPKTENKSDRSPFEHLTNS